MSIKTALITYDDYQHLPDDGNRYEIIGGELIMTPSPITIHQRVAKKLLVLIDDYVEKNELGEVFIAPFDVVLSMTDVVEPDLFFVSSQRSEIITKKNVVAAPDLVIEILSKSTEAIDRNLKKDLYQKNGIKEYWIVDPEEVLIEQYILMDGLFEIKGVFTVSEKFDSNVIFGLSISLDQIFKS